MSQHDQVLANQAGAAFRSDLNDALAALFTLSSGATAPSTTVAGMLWYDTANAVVKQRNAANSAWITRWTVANAEGVFTGLLDISGASAGQVKFPATQNASADVNTLDDYEEGTWTPVLTFTTPGDLSVAYSSQEGTYIKIGKLVKLRFVLITSTFTHTTAAGDLKITGQTFTAASSNFTGSIDFSGITKATYTNFVAAIQTASPTFLNVIASGSGVARSAVGATNMPTGGTVALIGEVSFIV